MEIQAHSNITLHENNFNMNSKTSALNCNQLIFVDFEKEIALTVVYSILLALCLFWLLYGYKFARITYMTISYSLSSCLSYFIVINYFHLSLWLQLTITISISAFLAFLCFFVKIIGRFVTGMFSGWAVSLSAAFLTWFLLPNIKPIYMYIQFIVFGVLGGSLNAWKPIYCCVFSICNISGICIFAALDFFLFKRMICLFALQIIDSANVLVYPCWFAWMPIIVWLFAIVFGCAVQYSLTSKDILRKDSALIHKLKNCSFRYHHDSNDEDMVDRTALV
ncbi:hypothetical protein HZS_3325 [Henneguya salminicola]|nr:hypothetical protein HZS_3325 [Henneguya salminicola]